MISCRNARADSLGVENALGRTTANCAERIAITLWFEPILAPKQALGSGESGE